MEEKQIHDDLAAIRGLMERSSKFISLSGLSGILAGVYALIGVVVAYFMILNNHINHSTTKLKAIGITIILVVLILSITTAILLTSRKAKRKGQPIFWATSRSLLFHMGVPLVTGGLISILFLYQGNIALIVPVMLIFYGLALVSTSNFTFTDVKYLGLMEIALGLVAACIPGYGLLFWAIGFGLLHIIYGSMMYLKYDK